MAALKFGRRGDQKIDNDSTVLQSRPRLTHGYESGNVLIARFLIARFAEVPMDLLSPMHLLIIFFIALLVFGPKKLPELGKGIGEGFRALKDGMKDKPAEPTATNSTAAPVSNASSNTTTEAKS